MVHSYVCYLRKDRGLTENSVLVYAPFIRNLLADQIAKTGSVSINALDTATIRSLWGTFVAVPPNMPGFWLQS